MENVKKRKFGHTGIRWMSFAIASIFLFTWKYSIAINVLTLLKPLKTKKSALFLQKSDELNFGNNLTALRLSHQEAIDLNAYLTNGPDITTIGPNFTFPVPLNDSPSGFLGYLSWHARQMNCLRNETCYNRRKAHIKIILWHCPHDLPSACQGIGDRLRGIVTTLALAMMTKRVFLLLLPENPYPFLYAVSPSALDWRLPEHIAKDRVKWGRAEDRHYPLMRWIKCPLSYTCIHDFENRTVSRPKRALPFVINITSPQLLSNLSRIGNFMIHSTGTYSMKFFSRNEWKREFPDRRLQSPPVHGFFLNRLLIRALFRPSPVVKHILSGLIPKNVLGPGYFGMHIRTGVDTREYWLKRFRPLNKLSPDVLSDRIIKCAVQVGLRKHPYIFFASDSVELKTAFARTAQKHNVTVMYSTIAAQHVAYTSQEDVVSTPHHRVTLNPLSKSSSDFLSNPNNEWLAFINVFVEFFGIANARLKLSTSSEFSRMAHLLSSAKTVKHFNYSVDSRYCLCTLGVH